MTKVKLASILSALTLGSAGMVSAQQFSLANGKFQYTGCAEVASTNFTSTSIVNTTKVPDLVEPVRFEVAKDGRIFFAERNGGVRVVQTDGSIVKLGTIPVFPITSPLKVTGGGSNELGLTGLVLAPDFATTGWIYFTYQPASPDISKVSRMKLTGNTLDLNSEQILMSFPMQKNYCCHTGGDMQFDNKGDLWISVGNNTMNPSGAEPTTYVDETNPDKDDQGHAANTNDYRGKILRIHPLPAAGADGKFYTVPAGNLRDEFATLWTAEERLKVLPEIYAMGHRSNYTIAVDTATGWLTWGDIGPDETRLTEEFNLTAKAGFFGWPYFAGMKRTGTDTYAFRLAKDEAAPMNTSVNNTGVQKLPPAIPAAFAYTQAAAITGPIYRWSASHTGAKKLPPHFDGKWFMTDFNIGQVHAVSLDAQGKITARTGLFGGLTKPIQLSIGPDGVLYTLEYGSDYWVTDGKTHIKRWEYTGTACAPPVSLHAPLAGKAAVGNALVNLGPGPQRFVTLPQGALGVSLYDLQGRLAWELPAAAQAGASRVQVPASVGNGVFRAGFSY